MRKLKPILYLLLALVMVSCSDDDGETSVEMEEPIDSQILVVTSLGGVGDNSYNDEILAGVMDVMNERGALISLYTPNTILEVQLLLNLWKQDADLDSTLIVFASSDYADLVKNDTTEMQPNQKILLFENDGKDMPDGVSTFSISRYGVSYLAGCMAQGRDMAWIPMGQSNDAPLEEARQGFVDGYSKYEPNGEITTTYLADDERGFDMPDSAYNQCLSHILSFVYPLAGGSNSGIYSFSRLYYRIVPMLVAGMDVDCSEFSPRIPFSVVINIRSVVKDILGKWLDQQDLPRHTLYGLDSGTADIKISDNFNDNHQQESGESEDQQYWTNLYNQYKSEAISKEEEYEKNK